MQPRGSSVFDRNGQRTCGLLSQEEATMSSTYRTWSRNKALVIYLIIAYALSWAIEIPLALQAQHVVTWNIPTATHYLASFGPLVAALISTALASGRSGL